MRLKTQPNHLLVPSDDFDLNVNGETIPCHLSYVYNWRDPLTLDQPGPYGVGPDVAKQFSLNVASFAQVTTDQPVTVQVRCKRAIVDPTIRPLSYHISPTVSDDTIAFTLRPGQQVSVEAHGDTGHVLHIFANLPEENVPDPDDPNVLFIGPGVHETPQIVLESNQTLYLAPGAVLRATVGEKEPFERIEGNPNHPLRHLQHFVSAWDAENVTIRGRGVIDTTALAADHVRKNPISMNRCTDVQIEGITLIGATCWTLSLYRCQNCRVENIKQISAFYNSDGINTVSSCDVVIRNCFLRNRDDGIAIKAMDTGNGDCFLVEPDSELPGGEVNNVLVENCVIWSDWGYAFGTTYETRKPISNVTIRNCDVIHATHPCCQGVIGILVSDKADVSHMRFEAIRIERTFKPIVDLRICETWWTVDKNLGSIHDVTFRDIHLLEKPSAEALASFPPDATKYKNYYTELLDSPTEMIGIRGASEKSHIRDITFEDITIGDEQLDSLTQMQINAFVHNVTVR